MKFRNLDNAEVARFLLALSVVAYATAIVQFIYPRVPNDSGRWSWLNLYLYENLGLYGLSMWWAVIGTILLISYFRYRR